MKETLGNEKIENHKDTIEAIKVLSISARKEIIQMINDLRPVAEIMIIPTLKERMLPAIKYLQDNGFTIIPKTRDDRLICFVSKEHDLAQEASDLLENGGIKNSKRFGELMGFPSGSIEAFLDNKNNFLNDEETERVIGFHNHFVNVALSKNNLEESVEYLKKTYKVLLEQSPDIFEDGLPIGEDVEEFKKKVSDFVNK